MPVFPFPGALQGDCFSAFQKVVKPEAQSRESGVAAWLLAGPHLDWRRVTGARARAPGQQEGPNVVGCWGLSCKGRCAACAERVAMTREEEVSKGIGSPSLCPTGCLARGGSQIVLWCGEFCPSPGTEVRVRVWPPSLPQFLK